MSRIIAVVMRVLAVGVLWVALWGDPSMSTWAAGVAVGVVLSTLFRRRSSGRIVVRPLRLLVLLVYFSGQMMWSTLAVVGAVIRPAGRVKTGIIAVPLSDCPDGLVTLIADMISLTPGTLTLEVTRDPPTLYVHALDTRDVESLRRQVRRLEVLTVRALGDEAALASLRRDDTKARVLR
ncbi:MAG: Na+/H+ antiporter subunit E [Acidimicrobiales bacterium]|nr:MAG: Na+/H+ antiporter subunit E [Acidimicrobiales bacterium]